MLVSATLIVRDEAAVLDGCLASIRDVVDEIIVVDTGSADDSPRIAESYGARVIQDAWQGDFARARNIALDAARGEWILYIDADERLDPTSRHAVEGLLGGAPEIAFRLLLRPQLTSTPYYEHRLWRHDPRIRFAGVIHEKVTPAIAAVAEHDGRPVSDCNLLLTHVGYEGDQTHKHRRNLPLLRRELQRDPDNLFNRHHLARVLAGLEHLDQAEHVLADAVELARSRPHDPLGVLAFTDLIRLRTSRGDDVSELLLEARERYPQNKLLWWIEADQQRSRGRHHAALGVLDRLLAVDITTLPEEGIAYDQRIFSEYAHDARGLCLFQLARYQEAADAYRAALQANPASLAYRAKHHVALGRARKQEAVRQAPAT